MKVSEFFLTLLITMLMEFSCNALEIEGKTVRGMSFRGELEEVKNGFLSVSSTARRQLSIPVDSIESMDLISQHYSKYPLDEILSHPEILGLWNAPVRVQMVEHLESLAGKMDWPACFLVAEQLDPIISEQSLRVRLIELKAWALYEMGLLEHCEKVLDAHFSNRDPITASVRYCWLKANLAIAREDFTRASYWSCVPSLRIPSESTELAKNLLRLGISLKP